MSVTEEARNQTVMMARIRNESEFIERCINSAFEVCKTVVLWDDGSTDKTEQIAARCLMDPSVLVTKEFFEMENLGLADWRKKVARPTQFGWIGKSEDGTKELHWLNSPFTNAVRPKERINEIRDKNFLWAYVKTSIDAKHILALDGDEMLSRSLINNWQSAIDHLEAGIDIFTIPFIYLWDSETFRRTDGVYGDSNDGYPKLRFPRLFTIKRQTEMELFNQHFAWQGNAGGFHCGSIPRESFNPNGHLVGGEIRQPIIHFGYLHDEQRHNKFKFYNSIDPNNKAEGEYRHIIGQRNIHQPGDVKLVEWHDE